MFFKDKSLMFIENNEFCVKLLENNSDEIITYSVEVFNKLCHCTSKIICNNKILAIEQYIKNCQYFITNKYTDSEENIINFLNRI